MADNTGYYTTYKELLDRLFGTQYVSKKTAVTLSGKAGNDFTVAGNSFVFQAGDILCQGIYAQTVSSFTSPTVTLDDGTDIINGAAYVYRTTKTVLEWQDLILEAMQIIDKITGQWFNSRALVSSFEGNNSVLLHFGVPMLTLTYIKLNNATEELGTDYYKSFLGRTYPDDRINPKLLLVSSNIDIFSQTTSRTFLRGLFTIISAAWGYLEEDGSTPSPIKKALSRIVLYNLNNSTVVSTGTIKREKTDIHETEYDTKQASAKGELTGDDEADRILMRYRGPISIGGNIPGNVSDYYTRNYWSY